MEKSNVVVLYNKAMKMYPSTDASKKYKDGHIFDEEKTVKWNREEVARKNQEIDDYIKNMEKERAFAYTKANKAACEYLKEYSSLNFSDTQFSYIFNHAHQEAHAYGIQDVINKAEEIIDLFEEVLALKED